MNRLAISLATRGRPEQLIDTIKRSVSNWTHPETVLYVMADRDDTATISAMSDAYVANRLLFERVRLHVAEREDTIAAKWNRILKVDADVYMVAADDDPYITPGYDTLTLEAAKRFPDSIGMVYGALANMSFTCSLSATRKWCDIVGYLQPELFPYWWVDHWTDDLAKITGRIAVSNIRTDQSKAGKTQEMREPAWWATYFDACYLMRRAEAHNIISQLDCPDWQRELLMTGHPLIEQRSRMINESVRQNARNLEGMSGLTKKDARYLRLQTHAMANAKFALGNPAMPDWERTAFTNILFPPTTAPNPFAK